MSEILVFHRLILWRTYYDVGAHFVVTLRTKSRKKMLSFTLIHTNTDRNTPT